MDYNLENKIINTIKILLWLLIIISITQTIIFDYHIAISFCNHLDIPRDLEISIVSPGIAYDFTIILLVIEFIFIVLIIKSLKNIKIFNSIYNFLCLEIL